MPQQFNTDRFHFILRLGLWRPDGRCGPLYPVNGEPAQCDPNGPNPCCSYHGWCGALDGYCKCENCIDYREPQAANRKEVQGIQ